MLKGIWSRSTLIVILFLIWAVSPARADDNIYLETVGGFGGSYIYMTYAYIGVTADAFSKEVYQAQQVKVMMDETVSMVNNLMVMLKKVRSTNIVENDKKFINSMLEVLDLLKSEAQALSAFASSKNPTDVERYDEARKKVWPMIKNLLGIK